MALSQDKDAIKVNLTEEEIRSLFPEVLTAYTPHTIATINDLLKELEPVSYTHLTLPTNSLV